MSGPVVVTEGISGLWRYHLSPDGDPSFGLCGARTMASSIAVEDWGVPFGEHFPKRPTWCAICADIRAARELGEE